MVKVDTNNNKKFDYAIPILNTQKYPRGIMEILEVIEGVSKIEIYDKNSSELLLSTTIL
jgi:hypothetical protein